MQLTQKHHEYWNRNLKVTGILLALWFVVTFVMGFFARELNGITILGFPFGFYMSAQGSLISLCGHHLVLRALHEQPGQGIRRP